MRFLLRHFIFLLILLIQFNIRGYAKTLDVAVLGDSMSWIGGENCEKEEGWTYYFKKRLQPHSIKVYARSGATWTNTPNTVADREDYKEVLDNQNVIYNQVLRLCRDVETGAISPPNLIIIYAGANDAWFEKQRPLALHPSGMTMKDIKSSDPPSRHLTMEESIMHNIKLIRDILPGTDILLVTPIEMTKVSPEKIADVSTIIENIGKKSGCSVVRADKNSGISQAEEKKHLTNTRDGVHTNAKGAKLIANLISENVEKLQNGSSTSGKTGNIETLRRHKGATLPVKELNKR